MDDTSKGRARAVLLLLTLPLLVSCGLIWWGGEKHVPSAALAGLLLLAGWSVLVRRYVARRAARDPQFAGRMAEARKNYREGPAYRSQIRKLKIALRTLLIFLALVFGSIALSHRLPALAQFNRAGAVTFYFIASIALATLWQMLSARKMDSVSG